MLFFWQITNKDKITLGIENKKTNEFEKLKKISALDINLRYGLFRLPGPTSEVIVCIKSRDRAGEVLLTHEIGNFSHGF